MGRNELERDSTRAVRCTAVSGRKTVLLTGATGNMGREALRCLQLRPDAPRIRIFVHPDDRMRREARPIVRDSGAEVVWGDLACYEDVLRAVTGADWVLHVGGLVSPLADRLPELTSRVNVGGAFNMVKAIRAQPEPDRIKLVYIGTVAQTGSRMPPIHWGRTGDPIKISKFDHYAVTKTQAEAIVAESGLRYWVSLRQTGIAHTQIWKVFDPIMFHNPLNGLFEWVTARDSGQLMANICDDGVPEAFWRGFYNMGGGASCRVVNHEFMRGMFGALGIRDHRAVIRPNWFATRNFHGQWYADSDKLHQLIPYRSESLAQFMEQLARSVPFMVKLVSRLAPGLIQKRIRELAEAEGGSSYWLEHDQVEQIGAFFGSRAAWSAIPDWDAFEFASPSRTPVLLEHGFDESQPKDRWTLADLREAARFRGGRCLSDHVVNPYEKLAWRCALGHDFDMSANLMLAGGHWCPTCMINPDCYERVASRSPFFHQVWQESEP
jgi:nucleoside-diphosphate-sugar epimerase